MTPAAKSSPALTALRTQLETLDAQLVDVLAQRVALARRIGGEKRALGLPLQDPRREAQVVTAVAKLARKAGLPEESVRDIFWPVVALCRRAQQDEAP